VHVAILAEGVFVLSQNAKRRIHEAADPAAVLDLASDANHVAHRDAVAHVGRVEPADAASAGAVFDVSRYGRFRPSAAGADTANCPDDGRGLVGAEVADGDGLGAQFVAKGQVLEQVADGGNVQTSQCRRPCRPHPAQILHRHPQQIVAHDRTLPRRKRWFKKGRCRRVKVVR
jgi:hypothetical protein